MVSNARMKAQIVSTRAARPRLVGVQSPARAEKLLLNRELSLVAFFRRVLEEAQDEGKPLLERLRFLVIFASSLDEFFMIRVSGLKEELEEGCLQPSPDGMTPAEQLLEIRSRVRSMINEASGGLWEECLPRREAQRETVVP